MTTYVFLVFSVSHAFSSSAALESGDAATSALAAPVAVAQPPAPKKPKRSSLLDSVVFGAKKPEKKKKTPDCIDPRVRVSTFNSILDGAGPDLTKVRFPVASRNTFE